MNDALTLLTDMPDTHGASPGGLWLSITDLAERLGVKKQSLSERVIRFEAEGKLTTRPGPHRSKLVNLAEFDRVASAHSTPQQLAAETVRHRRADAPVDAGDDLLRFDAGRPDDAVTRSTDPTLSAAHAQKANIETELKKLDLAERRRGLVAIGGPRGVEAAQVRAGAAIVRAMERIPARSAEVTAAALKDGEHGVRRLLRQFVLDAREVAAAELGGLKTEGLAEESAGPYEVELEDG
jgi:DNA-binding MarR family transcriptional regulator